MPHATVTDGDPGAERQIAVVATERSAVFDDRRPARRIASSMSAPVLVLRQGTDSGRPSGTAAILAAPVVCPSPGGQDGRGPTGQPLSVFPQSVSWSCAGPVMTA